MEKIFWVTKWNTKALQIGASFRDYKLRQEGLQNEVALGISNRGEKITDPGRDSKWGWRDFKAGQILQFETTKISNWDGAGNSGQQRFQIGAEIKNRGRDYKLVQNNCFVTKRYYITRIFSSQIGCYRKNILKFLASGTFQNVSCNARKA